MPTWKISKWFNFEACHSLEQLPVDHKCHRLHGHSYRIEVVIATTVLDSRGFAGLDYAELGAFDEYLDTTFDHRNLNDVMGMSRLTTAEHLAQHFFKWCVERWSDVYEVRLYETAKTCVTYRG